LLGRGLARTILVGLVQFICNGFTDVLAHRVAQVALVLVCIELP
jgi:hypothetical protein